MPFTLFELAIIIAILLVLIFVLPGKLPQIVRSAIKAKKEFEEATKEGSETKEEKE